MTEVSANNGSDRDLRSHDQDAVKNRLQISMRMPRDRLSDQEIGAISERFPDENDLVECEPDDLSRWWAEH